MSDAEPKSTSTVSQDPENASGLPAPVAVSEENLAALMRATTSPGEPDAERLGVPMPVASALGGNESSSGVREPHANRPVPLTNPPPDIVESRLALFAAVKENRSAISRSGLTAATSAVDQSSTGIANLTGTLSPQVAPRPEILAEPAPPLPAPLESAAASASPAFSRDQSDKPSRTRLVIGLAIGAVIAIAGTSLFVTRAHPSKAPSAVPSAPKDNVPVQARVEPPLQVRVEPLGNGLIDVRWDPQSAPIAQARDGRLVITEHNQQPRILALEAEQLKTGHLTYQSASESVQFDLEVVDRSGAMAKESILALQAPISATQTAIPRPQTQTGNAAPPVAQSLTNSGAAAPQPNPPVIRTFILPAAQHTTEQRAVIDAPSILTSGPAMPPPVGLPVPTASILPPPKKEVTVPHQVQVESSVEAANLIKKVIPVYPPLARSTGIQGTVRFTAHIGKDGRILNLKFTSGPLVLAEPATAAVKQWVYRPTLLDGQPVDVITQIDVNFTLHQGAH